MVHTRDKKGTVQQLLSLRAGGVGPAITIAETGILAVVRKAKVHTVPPLAVDEGRLVGVVITVVVRASDPVVRVCCNSYAIAGVGCSKSRHRQHTNNKDYCQQQGQKSSSLHCIPPYFVLMITSKNPARNLTGFRSYVGVYRKIGSSTPRIV
jgi:hypothetical protein